MSEAIKQFQFASWHQLPSYLSPRSGAGTCICEWAHSSEMPMVTKILEAQGGEIRIESWIVTFGWRQNKQFIHRRRYLT